MICQDATDYVACTQTPDQDGAIGRDAIAAVGLLSKVGGGAAGFDFTKLDAQGKPLADQQKSWLANGSEAAGTQWSCVRDNHTGLVWEMKQNDPQSLSYFEFKYTWRNTNNAENGGNAGTLGAEGCGGALCDTESFIAAINAKKLCGLHHWRLPRIPEIISIVNGGHQRPAFDVDYFPNGKATQYWSNQSYAPSDEKAWYIYMGDGTLGNQQKYSTFLARLVSNAETTP